LPTSTKEITRFLFPFQEETVLRFFFCLTWTGPHCAQFPFLFLFVVGRFRLLLLKFFVSSTNLLSPHMRPAPFFLNGPFLAFSAPPPSQVTFSYFSQARFFLSNLFFSHWVRFERFHLRFFFFFYGPRTFLLRTCLSTQVFFFFFFTLPS